MNASRGNVIGRWVIGAAAVAAAVADTSAAVAAKTTVVYWDLHGRAKFQTELIKEFNATHPDIEVVLEAHPGSFADQSQFLAAQISGTLPDLIYHDRAGNNVLMHAGLLSDLNPFIAASGWDMTGDWFPATLLSSTHEGHIYDIPRDGFPLTLFAWSKSLFAEAGLDPDKPPTTTAGLDAINPKLLRLDTDGRAVKAGFVPYAPFPGQYNAFWALMWGSNFWDASQHAFTINAERNIQVTAWLQSYAERLGPVIPVSWTKGNWSETQFMNGNLAMVMFSSNFVSAFESAGLTTENVGIAPMPSAPDSNAHRVYMAGEGFAIPKGAKHPKEAWEVLAWLMAKEQANTFAQATDIPPARISSFRYFMDRNSSPLYEQMLAATFNSEVVAVPGTPLDGVALNAMNAAQSDVVALKKSPKSALDEAQHLLEGQLQEFVQKSGAWW